MRIIVNHLTRLRLGDICVAGIDEATGKHIRPVAGLLRPRFLVKHGGFLDMACLVDLGRVKSHASPPHVEDWEFKPHRARLVSKVTPEQFRELLETAAKNSVHELFGEHIHPIGNRGAWGVEEGRGEASLGCLRVASPCRLSLHQRPGRPPQPRIAFRHLCDDYDLGVTDIRLFNDDRRTPNAAAIEHAASRLSAGGPVLLSVGLTRAFTSSDDLPAMHWLQVNNVHLPDELCWRLG